MTAPSYYAVFDDGEFPVEWGEPPPLAGNNAGQIRRRSQWIRSHQESGRSQPLTADEAQHRLIEMFTSEYLPVPS